MAQWADYAITAVSYDGDYSRITAVKRRPDRGDRLGPATTVRRHTVVTALENGTTYCTATKTTSGWRKGDDVGTVTVGGETFIRTDGNQVAEDNLGELPEF